MNISRKEFATYVKNYDFRGLFNYLGWNYSNNRIPSIEIKGKSYSFEVVADKSAFKIVVCKAADDMLPPYAIRCQIAGVIKNLLHEHILIFQSKKTGMQAWFYSYTVGGKAKKTEIVYGIEQNPERLYERAAGLIFDLDEEDNITILDVTNRVNANFAVNAERVTKKFYESFKREHSNLLKFIKGIDNTLDKEWYASIMLNRLMFCYFMQKRGFLNHDTHYLRHKLDESKAKLGENQFYSFYRDFLLTLFHKGFGSYSHSEEVRKMIGDIPYLNGGLFEVHEIEQKCPDIMIDDSAFESIFDLFDRYEWHLDSRECASGNEISPDVLGYIFEKYINDRAQMGAYYTQEDITEYISRNSIIPFIFTKAEEKCKDIFAPDGEIRTLIKNSGDKYIFESIKKGINLALPDYIEVGIDTTAPDLLGRRARWNEPADTDYALPTEIWREVVERRQRYYDTVEKIKNGTIATIQDFITYNLDICAFAQDVIDMVDDPQFIRVVYTIIKNMTILDPTCGSGAFLFAALNILEPLYSSCLSRMEDYLNSGIALNKFVRRMFEDELENIENNHPNKQYYIYKTIILNNLYGVDIMKEATETAKLRLFLKLVSTANPNYGKENIGIEPLPDIDFNIKCGNSLVGYATNQEVDRALKGNLLSMLMSEQVLESLRQLSVAMHRYKELQLCGEDNYVEFKEAKTELKKRQLSVNEILDQTLYEERREGTDYAEWLEKTQPFHWISEFYDIVSDEDGNGGFDVVIGNPPYISIGRIPYKIKDENFEAPDIYGYVINRCFSLMHESSFQGFIVMHNLAFSNSFKDVRNLIKKSAWGYFSFFARIPACLFAGNVRVRNCVYLLKKQSGMNGTFFTTRMHRWFSDARGFLFDKLQYTWFNFTDVIPMFACKSEQKIFETLRKSYEVRGKILRASQYPLYFKGSAYNWITLSEKPAPCYDLDGNEIQPTNLKSLYFESQDIRNIMLLFYNGRILFSHWLVYGDEFNVTKESIIALDFPIHKLTKQDMMQLNKIAEVFRSNLKEALQFKLNAGKRIGSYNISKLWHITAQSDLIFLSKICDAPELYYDAIVSHVSKTVLTQSIDDIEGDEE